MNTTNNSEVNEYRDARLVITMPSRITFMLFVPMRGGLANAMRASGRRELENGKI